MELIGGRPVVNSVNFEDGDGPESRFGRIMPLVKEHGAAVIALTIDEEGQARTAENKVRIASRLVDSLVNDWGMKVDDIIVDALTFPIATGQEETRRDAIETIDAIRQITAKYPGIHTTLGVSNVSFGLNPAARSVLNSVFLHEAVEAGLDSAIVNAAKIVPLASVPDDRRKVAMDLVWDKREYAEDGTLTYDPLSALLDLFAGVDSAALKNERAAELAALPVGERLERRIIDGEAKGLEGDLDLARADGMKALDIVNDHLLAGMQVVGQRFGSGEMQLPFVLQSAEVMKAAVALLEPHMEKSDAAGKGTMVIGTVRGDVHDIGKNLVDIILTNNGYDVINIGIKQPISEFIRAAEEHNADVIGMSGLLVKSTVVMKENLLELTQRGLGTRWPILLGGAALTRTYVEDDLASIFDGEVRYARDAFEGLALMEPLVAIARGADRGEVGLPPLKKRIHASSTVDVTEPENMPARSDVVADNPIPAPPFWGTRIVRGVALADYAAFLDERATFMGQWGLKPSRAEDGASYEELVETEGRPRLRYWLDRILAEGMLDASVAYGYFPAYAEGDDLVILHHGDDPNGVLGQAGLLSPDGGSGGAVGTERLRFSFPRQRRDRHLCLSDYVRSKDSGQIDVVGLQLVTAGSAVDAFTAKMFAENKYRDYLELNGLTMQLTEALAEYWHSRMRADLGFASEDPDNVEGMFKLQYRGARFSLGYPACPNMEDRTQGRRAAQARADGRRTLRGAAAAPRAVHRRVRVPPPGGTLLQRVVPRPIFARRSAASAAGPTSRMPTVVVTARTVSQVRVDVTRVYTPNDARFCAERRTGHVREPVRGSDRERPEPEVHEQPERVRRHDAIDDEHRDLEPRGDLRGRGEPRPHPDARQQSRPSRDPTAREHLERRPWPDPAPQHRRQGDREHPEQEAESGAVRPPGEDQDDEHGLQSADAGAGDPDRRGDGREHAEHRDRGRRMHRAIEAERDRDDDDRDEGERQHRHRGLGVLRQGGRDQRPAEPGDGEHTRDHEGPSRPAVPGARRGRGARGGG